MDINLEKEKAKYIHKLDLRRLIVDKILFGMIIVLIGLIANVIFEQYRSKLIEQRFILEKRLEAINSIKEAYEDMHNLWDIFTLMNETTLPKNYKEIYKEKINNFLLQSNRWNILFPKEFDDNLTYYAWIHSAIDESDIVNYLIIPKELLNRHRTFLVCLRGQFLSLCREYLGLQDEEDTDQFKLVEWSYEEAVGRGSGEYYALNFERWKEWKEKH